jgi:hypothetical protein
MKKVSDYRKHVEECQALLRGARTPESEFGGADANATNRPPALEHNRCKSVLIGKKAPDVLLEGASLPGGNERVQITRS